MIQLQYRFRSFWKLTTAASWGNQAQHSVCSRAGSETWYSWQGCGGLLDLVKHQSSCDPSRGLWPWTHQSSFSRIWHSATYWASVIRFCWMLAFQRCSCSIAYALSLSVTVILNCYCVTLAEASCSPSRPFCFWYRRSHSRKKSLASQNANSSEDCLGGESQTLLAGCGRVASPYFG